MSRIKDSIYLNRRKLFPSSFFCRSAREIGTEMELSLSLSAFSSFSFLLKRRESGGGFMEKKKKSEPLDGEGITLVFRCMSFFHHILFSVFSFLFPPILTLQSSNTKENLKKKNSQFWFIKSSNNFFKYTIKKII